jgi:hypothetical protein
MASTTVSKNLLSSSIQGKKITKRPRLISWSKIKRNSRTQHNRKCSVRANIDMILNSNQSQITSTQFTSSNPSSTWQSQEIICCVCRKKCDDYCYTGGQYLSIHQTCRLSQE